MSSLSYATLDQRKLRMQMIVTPFVQRFTPSSRGVPATPTGMQTVVGFGRENGKGERLEPASILRL